MLYLHFSKKTVQIRKFELFHGRILLEHACVYRSGGNCNQRDRYDDGDDFPRHFSHHSCKNKVEKKPLKNYKKNHSGKRGSTTRLALTESYEQGALEQNYSATDRLAATIAEGVMRNRFGHAVARHQIGRVCNLRVSATKNVNNINKII